MEFKFIKAGKKSLRYLSILLLFLSFTISFSLQVFGQAANLDQTRNGSTGFTSTTPTADWVNGNAGPQNAHYAEGWSIPYRMVVTGLTTGTHTLIIEWDTKQSGGHAIDFVTRYDFLDNPTGSHMATFGHNPETINPLLGLSGTFSAPTTRAFPSPTGSGSSVAGEPLASFTALAGNTYMTVYNGSIAAGGMTYDFEQPASNANATSSTRLRIVFTANASTVVFAWGGHIATQATWGIGQGASGVNGSPYHTRLISIDGSGGNQDRSLKSTAVIIPPTCSIDGPRVACPETNSLVYTSTTDAAANGAVTYAWSLLNNTANAMISGSSTGSSITVTPNPSSGDFTAGGSFNVRLIVTRSGATHTCYLGGDVSPGDNVVIDNVQVTATAAKGGSSTYSDPLTFSLAETSVVNLKAEASLNGTAGNSPFGFTWEALAPYTISGSNVQLAASPFTIVGTIANANTATPTFTATKPVDGLQFRVTATETASPNCQASDPLTINVTGTASCPQMTGPATICANSQNLTYTATGLAAILPVANTTYTWSIVPSSAASIVGDYVNVGSITVNSGTANFTVRLQITFTNQAISAPDPCDYPVTINDINPGTIAGDQLVCFGADPAAFTSTTPGSSTAGGTITYQWQSSTTSAIAGFNNIDGATLDTYDPSVVSVKTWFRRIATSTLNGITCSDNSNVVAVDLQQCVFPHLFPTQTTCCNYLGGNIESFQLQQGCITISGNKVSNATPGVFFYYGTYTATTSGSTTIKVVQTRDVSSLAPFLPQGTGGGNANVLVDNCQSVPGTVSISAPTTGQDAGNVTFTFTAIAGHTYVVLVKYDMKSIVNKNAPAPSGSNSVPWATYSFQMYLNNSSTSLFGSLGQLPLFASGTYSGVTYTCNANEQTPTGSCPTTTNVITRKAPTSGQVQSSDLQVAAYPNPYNSSISFEFISPSTGKASLEVYDLVGRKLAVIFQGNVDAGKQRTINYKVPSAQHVPMIYKLRVGNKTTFGKLLPGNLE